ncbi:LAQU0S04e05402g1_1 [Lachancea quebecensis]|uniref:Multiple RNA-binding domain-containing protein 1 n=1 Tax=Lachancea quebecensis TaxID=1654605 RepID=A0A0P1KPN9_9SACH|nr:LAQU0S04e05402g1_1 [Lachancea quebecensis]
MSRVIVKGLPKYLTEDQLKDHFSKRLTHIHKGADVTEAITDVKILKNRAGESRRFAFVGFRSEEDAFDAVNYFDQSFIHTCKIEVTMAKSFADPRVPQPMREKRREALKRLREKEDQLLEENTAKKLQKQKRESSKPGIDAEIKSNKQLQEFIDTMKPSSQVASWDNLGGAVNSAPPNQPAMQADVPPGNSLLAQALAMKSEEKEPQEFRAQENESDDEYTTLDGRKQGQEDEGDAEDEQMVKLDDFNEPAGENIAQDQEVSDFDWLKQRRTRIKEQQENSGATAAAPEKPVKVAQKDEATEMPSSENKEPEPSQAEPPIDTSEEEKFIQKIRGTGRLFLRNILYTATEEDFKGLFAPFGELEEVHVALDTRTGKSKGFAYIMFCNPEDAVNAYVELDKQIFQGRLLHILPADAKKSHRLDEFDLKNLPLKKQRALKRKANAAHETFSWNSLYMNQDAVLGSVAAKLGVQKSDLIDATDASAAVKQALAEAHVIGDVRKYFESKGMDLAKFAEMKSPSDRDDTVLLVKNFPFGTTHSELAELFLPFGKLLRLLLPPAQTIAVVQYRDATSARAAFTKLSYKRFKDGILYLEKGPKGCFKRDPEGDETVELRKEPQSITAREAKTTGDEIMDVGKDGKEDEDGTDDVLDGPTVSIFVKNLNFSTTTKELAEKFKPFSGFVVAQVKTKPDPKNANKTLSMGFGFAEFKTKEQAVAVIDALDGSVLDGHRVQLKLSHRQGSSTPASSQSKKKASGKIVVKNLPFEAERKQVFELFSSFGQLKSVRVPKKFDKSTRGFAFVEFLLPKEAENAMEQLQGVHLLGRRLVMQHAEQEPQDAEEQIARMTKKVKSQVATQELAALRNGGRRKVDLEGELDENDGLNGF